jgi:hypothetical protein
VTDRPIIFSPPLDDVRAILVYSRRKGAIPAPPNDAVYVGRGTPWGNPFRIDNVMGDTRDVVLSKFRAYAERRAFVEDDWLLPLRGKNLVCWCAPKPCHADVLIELANSVHVPGAARR